MRRWFLVLAVAACAKKPVVAPANSVAAAPATPTGAGWWCYDDADFGAGCERTQSDCQSYLDVIASMGGDPTADECKTFPVADCVSYRTPDGAAAQDCEPTLAACNQTAQYLAGSDDQGQARAQAGSITACTDTY